MTAQKIFRVLKTAAKYFSLGVGLVMTVVGLVTLAVAVPPLISIPIGVGIGLIAGAVGAYREKAKMQLAEARRVEHEALRQKEKKEHEQWMDIGRHLDQKVTEIAESEHKIEERLAEGLVPRERQPKPQPAELIPQLPPAPPLAASNSEPRSRSRVTIRINNLPTFFTVESGENTSPEETVLEVSTRHANRSRKVARSTVF
jgi:hypothetical protein